MPQLTARRAAFIALQWWREGERADSVVARFFEETSLGASDRAFTLELFYGVLRNLLLLDFWIGCLRPSRLDADLRDILRLGLYQLLLLGTPEHAAVNESVELAPPKGRGLINGVLRTAIRERDELNQRARGQPSSVRQSHPDFLVSRWQKQFGAEATSALCKWNNTPAPMYGRINRLKIDCEQFRHRYPEAEPSGHAENFMAFAALPGDAIARGHCYIQDPSTAVACQLLDPQPDDKVLDACAAPGGKTGYIAELMQNRGLIAAADRDSARLRTLQENAGRLGATIVKPIEHDWEKSKTAREIELLGPFNRILLDAPCTNTGVMRRRVDVRWRLRPDDFIRMQKRQLEIVQTVSRFLQPGGILVYSTCSLEPEENEVVVNRLLNTVAALQLIENRDTRPFREKCDGAFAAKFVRKS